MHTPSEYKAYSTTSNFNSEKRLKIDHQTPESLLNTIQGDSEENNPKILRGDQLQFSLLSESELKFLHKLATDSIISKYRTTIRNTKEKYEKLIENRRKRISDYILKARKYFESLITSLNKRCRLEVDFINYKAKQLNYDNILTVFRIWVISIIGDIRK